MRIPAAALAAALVLALPAFADAPETSSFPEPRPTRQASASLARPPADGPIGRLVDAVTAPIRSLRPTERGVRVATQQIVSRRAPADIESLTYGPEVGLCGSSEIVGRAMRPVPGRIAGCGIEAPVRVQSVAGVRLSRPTAMDCRTAKALRQWVASGLVPAVGRLGGGPEILQVASGYACRPRNNQAGAKISEHGRGRAIDISAIGLKNGQSIDILNGWGHAQTGPVLKNAWRAACGPFTTVLGPNADAFHRDHLHFDTTPGRGPYCR